MTASPLPHLAIFYERLADNAIPCVIVGSVASMHFGEPRSTIDIDLVVQATSEDAARIASAFPSERFYTPPIPVIAKELGRKGGQFNIIDMETGNKADCYAPEDTVLGRYQLQHTIAGYIGDLPVRFAAPAAIIAMKLLYHQMSGQDKHLRDIRAMLMTSPTAVDYAFLDSWTPEHQLEELWLRCQERAGEE